MRMGDLQIMLTQFNDFCDTLVGTGFGEHRVAKFETEVDMHFIALKYGSAEFRFRIDGYSDLYIASRLYNNCVVDAILE